MKPKVSIITPTYNREFLICETIESILAQTLKNFELIIIDDGSTDNTSDVVKRYLSDARIHYIFQDNKGEPSAVNNGWKRATGDYFIQINSDDPVQPDLLEEMCKAMDANPQAVLGYCDFRFIDEHGAVLRVLKNIDWDFTKQLKSFGCSAATPGTIIRRSAFLDWENLRQRNYIHINDIEMYWKMALRGEFIHVPMVLANWRQHSGQISYNRYESIPEIEHWYQSYFSQEDLPLAILDCKESCWASILTYFQSLVLNSELSDNEKAKKMYHIDKLRIQNRKKYVNLQVGDTDLIGNKFNGHDLHLLLNQNGVSSFHCVRNKDSDDKETILADSGTCVNFAQWLLHSEYFACSDIVHLHLIHNTDFDIQLLPLLSRLKPLVITLHDPYFMGGHCIYHGNCEKWKAGCFDCNFLTTHFSTNTDICALNFFEKEIAFQNTDINLIVASQWMEDKVRLSPIFQGKRLYRIPFGINQKLFRPKDVIQAKEELGIPKDNLVIMFRADKNPFKGLDVINRTLQHARYNEPVTLLLVGQDGLVNDFNGKFNIKNYSWVKDDAQLAKLYQACDIFLMPSSQEAFGMMAIEAMSCGKTVLALNGTSLPEVINSPDCGIAVEEFEFADAFQLLIDHPDERDKHGAASLQYAQEHYSLERYLNSIMTTYDEIMANYHTTEKSSRAAEQLYANSWRLKAIPNQYQLRFSSSWRLTKPLRAFNIMRKSTGKSFLENYRVFLDYMLDKNSDALDDATILGSRSWRITAPLRKAKTVLKG